MERKKERILIYPSDPDIFSKEVQYGVIIAKSTNRAAVLIDIENIPPRIMPNAIVGSGVPSVPAIEVEQLKTKAQSKLQKLEKLVKMIWEKVNYRVEIGFPEPKLLEMVEQESPYLLVIGQQHDFNLVNRWFGTFETRIAQDAKCPVLVVPQGSEWRHPQHIIYVTEDLSKEADNLGWLVTFAKIFKTNITIAERTAENDAARTAFGDLKEKIAFKWQFNDLHYFQILLVEPEASLKNLIRNENADWLAFQKQEKSFFQHLIDRDNDTTRILETDLPVLVF